MSGEADIEEEGSRRNYTSPYNSRHPIPTVQRYQAHRDEIEEHQNQAKEAQKDESDESKLKQAASAVKHIFKGEGNQVSSKSNGDPYPTSNRNAQQPKRPVGIESDQDKSAEPPNPPPKDYNASASSHADPRAPDTDQGGEKPQQSATESAASHSDPRKKRKDMKHMKRGDGGRQVTDPVTHLPIIIRDSTGKDLKKSPENVPSYGTDPRTYTGVSGASKSRTELDQEQDEMQEVHQGMERLFPPPKFDDIKAELVRTYQFAITIGLTSICILAVMALVLLQLLGIRQQNARSPDRSGNDDLFTQKRARIFFPLFITVVLSSLIGGLLIYGIRGWLGKKVEHLWDGEVWNAARQQEINSNESDSSSPESVAWLNSLLGSVWPLINPDLFTSVADMLEDVMQASLPKLVRMVSVDDIGQGSESLRFLGIRWLPTGAASQTVDDEGNLEPAEESQESDRTASGKGQVDDTNPDKENPSQDEKEVSEQDKQKKKQDEQEKEAIREGMEAEQGDFVNVELAFAYHARSSGKSLKAKVSNAHLYLRFYFPGGICIPVWVELKGIIGTMRLRLQLTPDPPFFSLCTLTFLGQPKADLSCVPLSKHNLNIMDVPLISGFVQSAIDAALAEYVAPKSLTLDLKDMLVGDDFKKDTIARGVVAVFIRSAKNFKEGDGGFGPMKGSSDGYVTVSWGKFGKPMASTRIIVDEQLPRWDQWAYVLVGPSELNAEEKLRLQLWDSDKYTADDDLGRVEVDLKELMHSPKTKNKICDREDRFTAEDPDEKMAGTISWSVGYFAKTRITEDQLAKQTEDPEIRSKEDLKKRVSETARKKLREATTRDESRELEQQETQDYKKREDSLINSSPPDVNYPSGILSIQIHNITGLEIETLRKRKGRKDDGEHENDAEDVESDDLPSSYCSIILNHQQIYKTRTKPKNSKPFFNAGTERFIKDWRNSEIIVSVRDNREGEKDAILGVVYLPLDRVFEKRSQINETYPLAGGIGFGRARISMVFRSTDLHAPESMLGWDYGTLEVKTPLKVKSGLSDELKGCRLRLRSNIAKSKVYSANSDGEWKAKHDRSSVFLAVHKRYASPLTIEFRKSTIGPDSTPAFAVFWLQDIPDEEEKTFTLKVWKGGKDAFKRARSCGGYEAVAEEKPLGEIEVTLEFWRGLSGWHEKWARRAGGNEDVVSIMEALDMVNDVEGDGDGEETDGSEDSSADEAEAEPRDGENEDDGIKGKMKKLMGEGNDEGSTGIKSKIQEMVDSHNDPADGRRGPVAQLRDYKDHHEQLHRRHRGLMQWRGARKLDWMHEKVKQSKGSIEGMFHHGDREPGIETEV